MKPIKIIGYMDYHKDFKCFSEDSFTYSKPTTAHTNPDIVSKKVELTIKPLHRRRSRND